MNGVHGSHGRFGFCSLPFFGRELIFSSSIFRLYVGISINIISSCPVCLQVKVRTNGIGMADNLDYPRTLTSLDASLVASINNTAYYNIIGCLSELKTTISCPNIRSSSSLTFRLWLVLVKFRRLK